MRLGLLGPAEGDFDGLAKYAGFLLNTLHVDQAVYLGGDDGWEKTAYLWQRHLLGCEPIEREIAQRAALLATGTSASDIRRFLHGWQARERLRDVHQLAGRHSRCVELLCDRIAVLVYDKALLDEEDMLPASLLVFGKADAPLIRRIGSRCFVSPGRIGEAGGVGLLDDGDGEDDLVITLYDSHGRETSRESMLVSRSAKFRIQGQP